MLSKEMVEAMAKERHIKIIDCYDEGNYLEIFVKGDNEVEYSKNAQTLNEIINNAGFRAYFEDEKYDMDDVIIAEKERLHIRVKFNIVYAENIKYAMEIINKYKNKKVIPEIILKMEPDNKKDCNAIAVFCGGHHIGHIANKVSEANRIYEVKNNIDLIKEDIRMDTCIVIPEMMQKWGGYLHIFPNAKLRPAFERKMLISRDWGAFMEVRKNDKLNLTDDAEWIMKIINHNPIRNAIPIKDLLNGDYTYEDVDKFICDFSKMHSEVFKVIKKEEK